MMERLWSLAAILLIMPLAYGSEEYTPEQQQATQEELFGKDTAYGSYVCVAHRVVGLQGGHDGKERFAGPIKLRAEEIGFVAKIAAMDDAKRQWCARGYEQWSRQQVFPPRPRQWWWMCETKAEVTFSAGKGARRLRGDTTNSFLDDTTGERFWISSDLRYHFYYTNLSGDWYMEEGVCQKQ